MFSAGCARMTQAKAAAAAPSSTSRPAAVARAVCTAPPRGRPPHDTRAGAGSARRLGAAAAAAAVAAVAMAKRSQSNGSPSPPGPAGAATDTTGWRQLKVSVRSPRAHLVGLVDKQNKTSKEASGKGNK